jgi:hypothetical protein
MEPKSQTVTEVTVREPPKKELPPPLIKVKSKVIPLKIIDKPEGVIQKQPEPPLSPKKTMPAVIKATQITGTKPSPTQRTINA